MSLRSKNSRFEEGVSLVELLVAIPIACIAVYAAVHYYNLSQERAWAQEKQAFVVTQNELVNGLLKKVVKPFIRDVTGPDGSIKPPASFWECNGAGCTMKVVKSGTSYTIINAQCVDIEDSYIRSGGRLNKRAVSEQIKASCLQCPDGKAPQLTINPYYWEGTSMTPKVGVPKTFPPVVGRRKDGLLAYGICVQAPGYVPFAGFMGRSGDTNRYDRWTITLIPVFANKMIPNGASDEFVAGAVSTRLTSLMLAGDRLLGEDSSFTPIK